MALYLISYDIAEKDAFEYQNLWNKLEALGATRILYSEWVLKGGTGMAETIYEVTDDAHWDKLLIPDEEFRKLLKHARH